MEQVAQTRNDSAVQLYTERRIYEALQWLPGDSEKSAAMIGRLHDYYGIVTRQCEIDGKPVLLVSASNGLVKLKPTYWAVIDVFEPFLEKNVRAMPRQEFERWFQRVQ